MKKKLINKTVQIPLYSGKIGIMIANYEVVIAKHYDDQGCKFQLIYGHTFMVSDNSKRVVLMAFNTNHSHGKVTHGTIAHEAFHATSMILDYAGCIPDSSSEEAYAYLLGWIVDQVYAVINKNNIKI